MKGCGPPASQLHCGVLMDRLPCLIALVDLCGVDCAFVRSLPLLSEAPLTPSLTSLSIAMLFT